MKGLPFVLLFTAMTFLAWGAYGPVLHHGAVALHHDSMRAFVGVGLAYFLIAVIFPVLVLRRGKEPGNWTISGVVYSLVAGAVGAIGALGIILALQYGGQTVYVMPLVFGFAPVVNTLVTAFLSRTFNQIRPIFIIGIVTAALGAAGVLVFKPVAARAAATASTVDEEVATPPADDTPPADESPTPADETPTPKDDTPPADELDADGNDQTAPAATETVVTETVTETALTESPKPAAKGKLPLSPIGISLSIIMAALCWGSYGPVLHIGQAKMNGSRLRPFACVGLAYFFIAVAAPLFVIYSRSVDGGSWTAGGMLWAFLAGVAGAIGALGVILAFNAGGKPYYVMPLIFGFAPVINTFISLSEAGTWGLVSSMFWISLAVVIAGAVTVLTNAPKPRPKPAT
ncbi:MAG: hypothetical protein R3C53_04165 [Pirellulaceae bacterium]